MAVNDFEKSFSYDMMEQEYNLYEHKNEQNLQNLESLEALLSNCSKETLIQWILQQAKRDVNFETNEHAEKNMQIFLQWKFVRSIPDNPHF